MALESGYVMDAVGAWILRSLTRPLGTEVSERRGRLAPRLEASDCVLRLRPSRAPGLYTTNAIESVPAWRRKIIGSRGHFPSDDAATKLIWLALRNITADWGRAAKQWREAMNPFAIAYGDRFARSAV